MIKKHECSFRGDKLPIQRPGSLKFSLLMKIRDLLKLIERDGWRLRNQEGSHRQFVHPAKAGKVTVAGHLSAEVDPKTKNSILKQAGIK
jgi:predicted RNA binding protein YcfA (HicA-like mRNA interferase family)